VAVSLTSGIGTGGGGETHLSEPLIGSFTANDSTRQCIFAGTVNHSTYLRGKTGHRRFWPITCGRINVQHLARDREQLWAEVKARFDAGCVSWLDTAELVQMASDEQNERYEGDPWEEVIGRWADDRPSVSRRPVSPLLGLEALPRTAWLAFGIGDIEEAVTRLFPLCSLGVPVHRDGRRACANCCIWYILPSTENTGTRGNIRLSC
jgi:hypothetical protein